MEKQRVFIGGQKIFAGSCAMRGKPGLSAYEVAVKDGYEGTELEWLDSLRGQDGQDGQPGATGATGPKGDKGDPGDNRSRLCAVAVAISATENAHQTLELADVMPSDDLQSGDLLLGTNGYTAWVSGGTDELVYTTSTGQRFNYKPDSDRFDVDLNDMVLDPNTGTITGGTLNKTCAQIYAAYTAGKIITLRIPARSDNTFFELVPLSNIKSGRIEWAKTTFVDPADPEYGFLSVAVVLISNDTFTGFYRET